jgi:hypothetical protein
MQLNKLTAKTKTADANRPMIVNKLAYASENENVEISQIKL